MKVSAKREATPLIEAYKKNSVPANIATLTKRFTVKYHPDKLKQRYGIEPNSEDAKYFTTLVQEVNGAYSRYKECINPTQEDAGVAAERAAAKARVEAVRKQAEQARKEKEAKEAQINTVKQQHPSLAKIVDLLEAEAKGKTCEISQHDYSFTVIIERSLLTNDNKKQLELISNCLVEAGLTARVLSFPRPMPALCVTLNRSDLDKVLSVVAALGEVNSLQKFMQTYLLPPDNSSVEDLKYQLSEALLALSDVDSSQHGLSAGNIDVAKKLINGIAALIKGEEEISKQPLLNQQEKVRFIADVTNRREGLINFCRGKNVNNKASRDIFTAQHQKLAETLQNAMPQRISALDIFIGIMASIATVGLINLSKEMRYRFWRPKPTAVEAVFDYVNGKIASPAA